MHARRVRAVKADSLRDYERPVPPQGSDPIGSMREPGQATVQGRLHATKVRPLERNNVLACEITDSTGALTALFYGRTHIVALNPAAGSACTAWSVSARTAIPR